MARTRDYKAEYVRRMERVAVGGLTRSQARGHARSGERPIKPLSRLPHDGRLEAALKALRATGSQSNAAKSVGISPERLRRFLRENALAERVGKTWRITDDRPREMLVLTDGKRKQLVLRGFEDASLVGRHLAATNRFVETNDISLLEPFVGESVTDANGKSHLLETRPNALHRLASDGENYPEIYRFVQQGAS